VTETGVTFWLAVGGWLALAGHVLHDHRDAVATWLDDLLVGARPQPAGDPARHHRPPRRHVRTLHTPHLYDQEVDR
jgi:hypothetical protein